MSESDGVSPSRIAELKTAFRNDRGWVHLNNAGLAPASPASFDAVVHWMTRFREQGMHCNDAYLAAVDEARRQLATLLNCEDQEIAFFQSTAGAISQVALGMKLLPGDEVLTWDQEYPSNLYPWKAACDRAGAHLVILKSGSNFETPAERLLQAITPRTRVIAISWVQYQTGAITDLKAVTDAAKAKGIWTVIDAIQGVGLLPMDFKALDVDAICGGSHKWLLSPVGVGYLAIRSERVRELQPLIIGAATFGTCDDVASFNCQPKRNAWKFEAGSKQVLEIVGLGASAAWLREIGVAAIQAETERLARHLEQGLRAAGYRLHSPHADGASRGDRGSIVCFSDRPAHSCAGTSRLETLLRQHHISYALRGPGIRLSPHAFNFEHELDLVLSVLN